MSAKKELKNFINQWISGEPSSVYLENLELIQKINKLEKVSFWKGFCVALGMFVIFEIIFC